MDDILVPPKSMGVLPLTSKGAGISPLLFHRNRLRPLVNVQEKEKKLPYNLNNGMERNKTVMVCGNIQLAPEHKLGIIPA